MDIRTVVQSSPSHKGYGVRNVFVALVTLFGMLPSSFVSPHMAYAATAATQSVSLYQYGNLPTAGWQTGNLNGSNAAYDEGGTIPYRIVFQGLTPGQAYKVTIDYPTTGGGKHIIDYLTSYDRSISPNPCDGFACVGPAVTLPIPIDAHVTVSGVTQLPGQFFTLYNGTFVAAPTTYPAGTPGNLCTAYPCIINQNPSPYVLTGSYLGDSDTSLEVYIVANASTAVLAWGGHIATRTDWGSTNTIIYTTGAAYHMILQDFTCQNSTTCTTGKQTRSLSATAVTFGGFLTIVKRTDLLSDTAFPFTASPAPLADFTLVNSNTFTNSITFGNIITFTTYRITETTSVYWTLNGVDCSVAIPNGGSSSISGSTATINLANGEMWTCTFTNTVYVPALALVKHASPATYSHVGDVISYTYDVTNTGNVALQGPFTVADDKAAASCPATGSLAIGASIRCTASYSITQADLDAGSLTNVATAHGLFSGVPVTSTQAQATVIAVQTPQLALAKSVAPITYTVAGQVITYTYILTNTGNVTLHEPFTISDSMTTATCPPTSSLGPGGMLQCTGTYTITSGDMANGSVTNVATASAMFDGTAVTSNQAQSTVTLQQFTLTLSPTSGGAVTSEPPGIDCGTTCSANYDYGTVVTLTATPAAGYMFSGWQGACTNTTGPCVITVTAGLLVTPTFTLLHYGLAVSLTGNGSGSVTSSPAGIDCGSTCTADYDYGTVVTLTAAPATGSTFAGWTGACTGTADCVVTITGLTNVTATFTLQQFTLTSSPTSGGAVTSEPPGIDCGTTCSANYDYGTVVTLTATPAVGYMFSGWQGACTNTTGLCVITISGDTSVTATFSLITTDLMVNLTYLLGHGTITYTAVVVNNGPADAPGTIVSDTLPAQVTAGTWTCQAANGAACAAPMGSGSFLHESLPAFPAGGVVTYTIVGSVDIVASRIPDTFQVIAPPGVTDSDLSNNSMTVITGYRLDFPIVLLNAP